MGLLSKTAEVKLGSRNIKYYEKLGYIIPKHVDCNNKIRTKRGDIIEVKVEDLTNSSHSLVNVKCDGINCNKIMTMMYKNYKRCCNETGQYYCNSCANVLNGGSNAYWYGKGYLLTRENNSNWNPNITDEERELKRNTLENTEWTKKVLARDNYICQCCNKQANDLVAHHLDGWNWCKEKRYDETNGITLCKICHKNFHLKYGNGDNTKGQFEEWIGQAIELLKYEGELPTARKIYCIEENKIYDSAEQIKNEWGLKGVADIYKVCNHKSYMKDDREYKYKLIKNKHLLWVDEYEKMTKEDLILFLKNNTLNNKKLVYCLTTNEKFNSAKDGAIKYKIKSSSSIIGCCKHQQNYKHAGYIIDSNKNKIPLAWMYYNEWLKLNNEE